MLCIDTVRSLPEGVGVRYTSGYTRNALFIGIERVGSDREAAVFVTASGAYTKPLMKNYGKTWKIEAVNGMNMKGEE